MITARQNLENDDPDSACNRAYYCMFNAARAALILVGQPERAMAKTHSGMLSSFSEFLVKPGYIAVEHSGHFAFESSRRMLSDYAAQPIDEADAQSSIANAEAFLAAIRSMNF